jgi:uncharacterized protein (DUF2252 family)
LAPSSAHGTYIADPRSGCLALGQGVSPLKTQAIRLKDRGQALTAARQMKMARSAHAYVRGATEKFYAWLESASDRDLPQGPPVWICGDCHLGNLGPVANAKGQVGIQIRDLDQTVIGNPAHDLIRLSLSLATAARGSDLPGVATAKMLEEVMAGYQAALAGDGGEDEDRKPRAVRLVLRRALGRRWRHLAEERIEDVRPQIPLGRKFWALEADERDEISALFAQEPIREMVTGLSQRDDGAPIEVLDAAYWMKGCSSLGRLRYAVLLQVGKADSTGLSTYSLVDIKEATKAAAPRAPRASMPRNNAERVVAGARALSPYLGNRMRAASLGGRQVVLRELMPQDLKLEIEQLTADEAMLVARYLAGVVGRAHGRQMDETTRAKWAEDLGRRWPKGLEAPFWLWGSVVDLISLNEVAYLEHCRRYALEPTR